MGRLPRREQVFDIPRESADEIRRRAPRRAMKDYRVAGEASICHTVRDGRRRRQGIAAVSCLRTAMGGRA